MATRLETFGPCVLRAQDRGQTHTRCGANTIMATSGEPSISRLSCDDGELEALKYVS